MSSARPTGQGPTVSRIRETRSLTTGEGRSPPADHRAPFGSLAIDLLTVIGRDGWFKRLAPRFPQAFGYTEAELLDAPFISFIHPLDCAQTSAALEQLGQGAPTLGLENRFRCKDGSYRQLAWTAMPTPEGLLYAVARDVTKRKPMAAEHAQSVVRTQPAAVTQKPGFLASVCHDAQQPLTVILAQTQLLQRQLARGEALSTERLATRLGYIFAAATHMRGMSQDLLDACLQESGQTLTLVRARTDLVALARDAVSEHELISAQHHFSFESEMATLEATVDEIRVHRILANLLTNAIKYSPAGGAIWVSVKTWPGPLSQLR